MKIQDALAAKSTTGAVTISPESSVRDLLQLLAEQNIGAVVVAVDGEIAGIVSERDVVRKLHQDEGILAAPVSQIMTAAVHQCQPADSLEELMAVMTNHRVRHVPVTDDGALVGVISIGDVVKHRIDQLEFERDQLDSYVHQL